ncbi:hypothetical protein M0812_05691 [Anaeramoeba flamelloides]|uniref:Uncharacterized protein n=1 Tax=Anaeramoeba flamelloides TaxID=1746091 RepID=A0AAV8AAK2_9EUKA|nr:hypothetical protein M0812_05691 [Anaeramoeba flamelloides]
MTCQTFQELFDNDLFWNIILQLHHDLFIWKSLRIRSTYEGKYQIIGELNDSILGQTTRRRRFVNKPKMNEGLITETLYYNLPIIQSFMQKYIFNRQKKLCKPQTNERMRIEYLSTLRNPKEELFEKYNSIKNAIKLKDLQEQLLQNCNDHLGKVEMFWKTNKKLFTFSINLFWIAIFLFGLILNLQVVGKMNSKHPYLITLLPLICVVGLNYCMIFLSLIIHHNKVALIRSICLIIGLSILISPVVSVLLKLEHFISLSWGVTFIPCWLLYVNPINQDHLEKSQEIIKKGKKIMKRFQIRISLFRCNASDQF